MKRFTLNGISIELLSTTELDQRIRMMLRGTRVHHIVTVNPEFIVTARHDRAFRNLLATADLATADGTGIILAARMRGIRATLSERITGVDLTVKLLTLANNDRLRVMIALKQNSLVTEDRLRALLKDRFPHALVTIIREPYDLPLIHEAQPHILFSALGSPAQEFWIREHAKHIPSLRIALGIGGTFDLLSGTIQRAPRGMQKMGLEWLWRLALEPKRLPRILRATIVFLTNVLLKRY